MEYSLFQNSHFQMGVNAMGFAEHFGLYLLSKCKVRKDQFDQDSRFDNLMWYIRKSQGQN